MKSKFVVFKKYVKIFLFHNFNFVNFISDVCNSGFAGAGGIIFDPGGNIVSSYAWGLGLKTNNEAKWLTLFFGLKSDKQPKITKIIFLGYYKQVIHKMMNGYNKVSVKIWRIYEWIRQASINVQTTFYHILRGNNIEADKLANQGAKLKMGLSEVNGNLKNTSYVP